ncbi:MAG: arginyltransferase [Candidatus Accumulibacter sp.]|jgi:arginine-tRNA-protein transferase|nr:arginyltransferase [Accumulibacter sp.]
MARLDDPGFPRTPPCFHDTAPYPCGYLPGRQAVSRVAIPPRLIGAEIYGELVRRGFRRSGEFAYRPACRGCRACVPVRVPVERFSPDRSQRRCLKANRTLAARERPLDFAEEHYSLYRRYQMQRHPGGGMDGDDGEQYAQFLLRSHVDTRLVEFRDAGRLRMVSIIDALDDGFSSVYAFFDPELPAAGLGTYNVLWQIQQCRARELPYLYLGYWIGECRKMNYKARFRPIEGFIDGLWREIGSRRDRCPGHDDC